MASATGAPAGVPPGVGGEEARRPKGTFLLCVDGTDAWRPIYSKSSDAFFFVGYGASRQVEKVERVDVAARQASSFTRARRIMGLFEETFSLLPLSHWLPRYQTANPGRFVQVRTLVNRLLGPGRYRFTGQMEDGEYVFQHGSTRVPFPALSDGYRAFLGWIGDLLYHVCETCPSGKRLDQNQGIVMVDEVDLHLHPAWQTELLPRLADALPKIQFIATSHSPLLEGTRMDRLPAPYAPRTGRRAGKRGGRVDRARRNDARIDLPSCQLRAELCAPVSLRADAGGGRCRPRRKVPAFRIGVKPAVAGPVLQRRREGGGDAQAFSVTTDHDRQRSIWARVASQGYSPSAWQVKRMLTEERVPAGSPMARLVGVDAYEATGGPVLRDLFADDCERFQPLRLIARLRRRLRHLHDVGEHPVDLGAGAHHLVPAARPSARACSRRFVNCPPDIWCR